MTRLGGLFIFVAFLGIVHGQTSLFGGYKKKDGYIDDIPTIHLSNDKELPLIGLGVGNLQKNRIENMIYEGLKSNHRIRLIDTAHASLNEKEVAKGIVTGVKRFKTNERKNISDDRIQVHVVTKIWYTYLGYERTKVSVQESLNDLAEAIKDPVVDLKVHILLHWPKCYDHIEWMDCEREEINLPMSVRNLEGLPPHLNKENAWKESWRALEDIYDNGNHPTIASIGVSNFGFDDLTTLIENVSKSSPPHIIQLNVWSLLSDPKLIELCNRNNIHIQVYNVMNGILGGAFSTPHAHHHVLMVANKIRKEMSENKNDGKNSDNKFGDDVEVPAVTVAQVIMKWLVQYGISIIPRTSNLDRLLENSAVAISQIPDMDDKHIEIISHAVEAMLSGKDMKEDVSVEVAFHASTQDMYIYFIRSEESETQIGYVSKGDTLYQKTHPHHKFRAYNAYDPDVYHTYTIQGSYGDKIDFHVEL